MNRCIKWIPLIVVFAFLSTAKAEFEETTTPKPRVVRPTVVCEEGSNELNETLKKLQVGSYKISHFSIAKDQYTDAFCVVVEPQSAK